MWDFICWSLLDHTSYIILVIQTLARGATWKRSHNATEVGGSSEVSCHFLCISSFERDWICLLAKTNKQKINKHTRHYETVLQLRMWIIFWIYSNSHPNLFFLRSPHYWFQTPIPYTHTKGKHATLTQSDSVAFHCKTHVFDSIVSCGHAASPRPVPLWRAVVWWERRGRSDIQMWTTLRKPFVAARVSAGAPSPPQPDRRLENCHPRSVALAWISTQIIIKSSVAQRCQCEM